MDTGAAAAAAAEADSARVAALGRIAHLKRRRQALVDEEALVVQQYLSAGGRIEDEGLLKEATSEALQLARQRASAPADPD